MSDARLALLAVLVFSLAIQADADEGVILGNIPGTAYIQLDQEQQLVWFTGVLDGVMAETFFLPAELHWLGVLKSFDPNASYGTWMGTCIARYSVQQLEAIFKKELESNPEQWHVPAGLMVRATISEFCKPTHVKKPKPGE